MEFSSNMATLVNVDTGEELRNIPSEYIYEPDEDLRSISRLALSLLLHRIRPSNLSINYWPDADTIYLRSAIENEIFHVDLENKVVKTNVPVAQYRVKVKIFRKLLIGNPPKIGNLAKNGHTAKNRKFGKK